MIFPTLGNFAALKLFWEWMLNKVWSRTISVVVRTLVIGSWNCSFVYPGGISKLLFLCMFFVYIKKKRKEMKRKQRKEIKGVWI